MEPVLEGLILWPAEVAVTTPDITLPIDAALPIEFVSGVIGLGEASGLTRGMAAVFVFGGVLAPPA